MVDEPRPNRRRADHWRMLTIAGVIVAYMATNALVIVQHEQQRTDSLAGRKATAVTLCRSQNMQNKDIRALVAVASESPRFKAEFKRLSGEQLKDVARPLNCAALISNANVKP